MGCALGSSVRGKGSTKQWHLSNSAGSLIYDNDGDFGASTDIAFFVGEPQTLSPTMSAPPTASVAPTFDLYPITIALQLDQWSSETGMSIRSKNGRKTFYEWESESFLGMESRRFVETVHLPRNIDVNLWLTDTGGDGFCKYAIALLLAKQILHPSQIITRTL